MKLRNKKTGEIGEAYWVTFREDGTDLCVSLHENGTYEEVHSLAELNEDWEDYEPEEPKITDPEWRHVVRKWYELNGLEGELRVRADVKNYKIIGWRKEEDVYGQEIDIPLSVMECETDPFDGTGYTIDELCGEEEAPEPLEPTFVDLDERIKEKEGECES